jgi:hypothetical protein
MIMERRPGAPLASICLPCYHSIMVDGNEIFSDFLFPIVLFLVLYATGYFAVKKLHPSSKMLKKIDFVWLSVAVLGLMFSSYDLVKTDAKIHAAQARSEYRRNFSSLRNSISTLSFCDPNTSILAKQIHACHWSLQVSALFPVLDKLYSDPGGYFPDIPQIQSTNLDDALGIKEIQTYWHAIHDSYEQWIRYEYIAMSENAPSKRIGLFLLAAALAGTSPI